VKESATLELRDDVVHEISIGARDMGRGDDESVARSPEKLFLQRISDFPGTANDGVIRSAAVADVHELADGGIGAPAQGNDPVANRLQARHRGQVRIAERLVETPRGKIEVERLRQKGKLIDVQR